MALVFRIENSEGVGPYRCTHDVQWGDDPPMGYRRHPTPYDDEQLREKWEKLYSERTREHYVFGFNSEDQMLDWFHAPEWLKAMDKAGQLLCVYEVPQNFVCHGNSQTVFRKDKAQLVSRRSLV